MVPNYVASPKTFLRNPVIGSLIALAERRYDMFIKANAGIKNEIAKGKICGPMVKDDWRQSLASSEPHAQDRVRIEACIDEHPIKLSGSELFEKPPPHGIELGQRKPAVYERKTGQTQDFKPSPG